jgi:hypothetical protein
MDAEPPDLPAVLVELCNVASDSPGNPVDLIVDPDKEVILRPQVFFLLVIR